MSAALPKSAGTDKTVLAADGKVKWETTDHIVVNDNDLQVVSLLSDTIAEFSGSVGAISGGYYWGVYPTASHRTPIPQVP